MLTLMILQIIVGSTKCMIFPDVNSSQSYQETWKCVLGNIRYYNAKNFSSIMIVVMAKKGMFYGMIYPQQTEKLSTYLSAWKHLQKETIYGNITLIINNGYTQKESKLINNIWRVTMKQHCNRSSYNVM